MPYQCFFASLYENIPQRLCFVKAGVQIIAQPFIALFWHHAAEIMGDTMHIRIAASGQCCPHRGRDAGHTAQHDQVFSACTASQQFFCSWHVIPYRCTFSSSADPYHRYRVPRSCQKSLDSLFIILSSHVNISNMYLNLRRAKTPEPLHLTKIYIGKIR